MFERCDLTKKTDDKVFLKDIEPLQKQLGILQRDLRDKKIPVIIVVEGWNASGITMVMNELIHFLDPRGFSLHSIGSPSEDERARPLLLRFWEKIPAKGRIALFARSGTVVHWQRQFQESSGSGESNVRSRRSTSLNASSLMTGPLF